MIKNKKQMFIVIGAFVLTLLLGSTTYAFFNYTRTGSGNVIKVGRISFVSKNEETITLNNLFPIDPSNTSDMNDSTKVGTYSIDIKGDTDYVDGIEYLVSAVDANIYTSEGQIVPITLDFTVTDLGDSNANYFSTRENTNTSIYKKLVGDTLVGDQMLLVGFIKPNTTSGTAEGVNGKITIKAYLNKNNILISDTYDGTESDNMGTTNNQANGKTVITTSEWNALQNSGVSFKVKVEANQGIWVKLSLEEIMKRDNIGIDIEHGVDFSKTSEEDGLNGEGTNGVYLRSGTESDTNPILYYRGAVENNNVVFANKCWKAVRTTDTGGVKLIYNGLSSEVYEQVALEKTNYIKNATNTDSRWTFDNTDKTWNIEINDDTQPVIEFTVPTGDNYSLVMTGTSGSTCGGGYTFYKNGTSVKSGANGGGAAMNLSYDFGTLTTTDIIKMNYTGNSSSTCTITFKLKMTKPGTKTADLCDKTGVDTHISVNGTNSFVFNVNQNLPAYNGYMYGDIYTYNSGNPINGAYFGTSFTWDGTNYKLVDAVTPQDNTHHYTCNLTNAEGICTTIRYYYQSGYYIILTSGDGIEEALAKMQKNTTNSNAKDKIDTWYASNLASYTNKLEDTIWCNDRSIGDNNNNGWIANGGDLSTPLYYGARERSNSASNMSAKKNQPSLECSNKNDRFTVNKGNGNGSLTYPVALLTEDEMVLAGVVSGKQNRSFYLNNGNYYWTLSPEAFYGYYGNEFDLSVGSLSYEFISSTDGLRPSISIKPGQLIIKGTGTVTDPYVIE